MAQLFLSTEMLENTSCQVIGVQIWMEIFKRNVKNRLSKTNFLAGYLDQSFSKMISLWKELSKCLDDVFVQIFGRKIRQLQLFPHAPVLLKDKQL